MRAGDWARLRGPEGNFTLPRRCQALAFLSGGIGITPLRSMMRYIADKQLPYDVTLVYGNASLEETAFREELDDLCAIHSGLRVVYVLSGPDVPSGWKGKTGVINRDLVAEVIPDYRKRLFYVSGPPRMVLSPQDQLIALGVRETRVRRDSFTGYD